MGIFRNSPKTTEISSAQLPLILHNALVLDLNQNINASGTKLIEAGYTLVDQFAFEYFAMIMVNYINSVGTLSGNLLKEEEWTLMVSGFTGLSLKSFLKCYGISDPSDENFSVYWKELHKRMRVWHEGNSKYGADALATCRFVAGRFVKQPFVVTNMDDFEDILFRRANSLQALLEMLKKITVVK